MNCKLISRATHVIALVCIALGLSSTAMAQPENFVKRMPSVADVRDAVQGADQFDREARLRMVFRKLIAMVSVMQEMEGRNPHHQATPAEDALKNEYSKAGGSHEESPQWNEGRRGEFYDRVSRYERDEAFNAEWMAKLLPEDIRLAVEPWHHDEYGPTQSTDSSGPNFVPPPAPFDPMSLLLTPWVGILASVILYGLAIFMLMPVLTSDSAVRIEGRNAWLSLKGKTFALKPIIGEVTSIKERTGISVSGNSERGYSTVTWQEQVVTIIDASGKKHPIHVVDRGIQADPGDRLTAFQIEKSRKATVLGFFNHESDQFFGTTKGVKNVLDMGGWFYAALLLGAIAGVVGALIAWTGTNFGTGGYGRSGILTGLSGAMSWIIVGLAVAGVPILLWLKNRKINAEAERVREKALRPYLAALGEPPRVSGATISGDAIILPDGTVLRPG